jgi:LPXTG-site transpeptidase (sortase) family protein
LSEEPRQEPSWSELLDGSEFGIDHPKGDAKHQRRGEDAEDTRGMAVSQTRSDRRKASRRGRRGRRAIIYVISGLAAVTVAAWAVIIVAGGGWSGESKNQTVTETDNSAVSVFGIDPPPPDVPSLPTHLTIGAIGVDTDILPYTVEDAKTGSDLRSGQPCYQDGTIVCIDPPSPDLVYWQVGGEAGVNWGDMPGADSNGTVYLHGHSGDPSNKLVFNDLPNLQPGDTAEISTEYGVFVYTVESVRNIPKDDYPYDEEVLAQVPGRLLLVTCFHGAGADLINGSSNDNTVVTLQMTDNRPLDS